MELTPRHRFMLLMTMLIPVLLLMIGGGIWLAIYHSNDKVEAKSVPTIVQTPTDPKDEPTLEPTTSSTSQEAEEVDEDEDVDMTGYKVHKLPKDSDDWTDQEWEWWAEAAIAFNVDYTDVYVYNFGEEPSEEVVDVAKDFAEETCSNFDNGYTLDDVAEAIVDSGGSQDAQRALAIAVKPGVENFCPWNKKKLK